MLRCHKLGKRWPSGGSSPALHAGLTPVHFEAATSYGIFFSVASAALAVAAAFVLAWPSRPAYAAGAALAVALILLWALFRLVPPLGAESVEEVDLVGLVTKGAELTAALACAALLRTHRLREEVGA